MSGSNDRTGVGNGSGEWRTPPELWHQINRMFELNYDAFATHENRLCSTYSTTEGTFESSWDHRPPGRYSEANGMAYIPDDFDYNRRRYGNPPYSRGLIEPAMRHVAETRDKFDISVLLIPDARDTLWWKRWVKPFICMEEPLGRVHFVHPPEPCIDKKGDTCTHPLLEPIKDTPGGHVLVVYRPSWMD